MTFKEEFLQTGLVQAPLAGYSAAPFRALAHKYGKPDYCCTEMLSAHHIYVGAPQRKRYTYKSPDEGKLCVQLAGREPNVLAMAAIEAVKYGADLIDLNCGCPVPKVRKRNMGSKLIENITLLQQLVEAMTKAVAVPITVKVRITDTANTSYNQDVAGAIAEAGAKAITVHGRTWQDKYDVAADYAQIAQIKQAVNIPVIGNGDVSDVKSAQKMLNETGCDAIMLARSSVGQPWLFSEIAYGLAGNEFVRPDLEEIGEIFLEHVRGLITLEGERVSILEVRKFAKYYARNMVPNEFVNLAYKTTSYDELFVLVKRFFKA